MHVVHSLFNAGSNVVLEIVQEEYNNIPSTESNGVSINTL